MEMSIETAMRNLSMYDIDDCGNAELHTWYNGIEEDMEKSFKVAVETMRKYQKIVNIVSLNDEEFKQCGLKELKEILEVIADGNVD